LLIHLVRIIWCLHTPISVQGPMILIFFLWSFRSAGDTPDRLTWRRHQPSHLPPRQIVLDRSWFCPKSQAFCCCPRLEFGSCLRQWTAVDATGEAAPPNWLLVVDDRLPADGCRGELRRGGMMGPATPARGVSSSALVPPLNFTAPRWWLSCVLSEKDTGGAVFQSAVSEFPCGWFRQLLFVLAIKTVTVYPSSSSCGLLDLLVTVSRLPSPMAPSPQCLATLSCPKSPLRGFTRLVRPPNPVDHKWWILSCDP
jgi:hypothetical protein